MFCYLQITNDIQNVAENFLLPKQASKGLFRISRKGGGPFAGRVPNSNKVSEGGGGYQYFT